MRYDIRVRWATDTPYAIRYNNAGKITGYVSLHREDVEMATDSPVMLAGFTYDGDCIHDVHRERFGLPIVEYVPPARTKPTTPDWQSPEMPILKYQTSATMSGIETMQAVADAMLPYCIGMPVAIVFTRDAMQPTSWTFTGHPAHDTIRSKVETIAATIAGAVNGRDRLQRAG